VTLLDVETKKSYAITGYIKRYYVDLTSNDSDRVIIETSQNIYDIFCRKNGVLALLANIDNDVTISVHSVDVMPVNDEANRKICDYLFSEGAKDE